MNAVKLTDLTKRYPGSVKPSVSRLNIEVDEGEVYGFLGSNGAGKSTTIRTMMGFINPTEGAISILGHDVTTDGIAVRASVGYLAGDVALPRSTTGRALLQYLAKLGGGVDQAYLSSLIDRFEAQVDKKIGTLSKGNRQKIGLIQAFMHQPKVLVLDEPTSGLDPLMQEEFFKLVEEAKARGAAVFLSSHSFSEVERICDRVGIIREGVLVHEDEMSKLVRTRMPRWNITLKKKADMKVLEKSTALNIIEQDETTLVVEPKKTIEAALAALSKVGIASMVAGQQELEDEFMSFYGSHEELQV